MAVHLTRIYTRTGDQGDTRLGDMSLVRKDNLRVAAYGEVDELNAVLGVVRLQELPEGWDERLGQVQNDLFDLGADLARPMDATPGKSALRIIEAQIGRLESEIDRVNATLAPLTSFILPGGTAAAAYLHLARTVVRRAERLAVALATQDSINPQIVTYLNRLSDHLFVLARALNEGGKRDILWVPGENR